jgi:hypothetical protein
LQRERLGKFGRVGVPVQKPPVFVLGVIGVRRRLHPGAIHADPEVIGAINIGKRSVQTRRLAVVPEGLRLVHVAYPPTPHPAGVPSGRIIRRHVEKRKDVTDNRLTPLCGDDFFGDHVAVLAEKSEIIAVQYRFTLIVYFAHTIIVPKKTHPKKFPV